MIVVRENTECLYVKQEQQIEGPNGKEARATRLITERASRRIGEMAFKLAEARPAKVCPPCTELPQNTEPLPFI